MKKIPSMVKIASDKWVLVKQKKVEDGKLGYWDGEDIVIKRKQAEIGKWIILIHEIIHALDGQNVANKLYKKQLTEEQVTYLSAGLFASLAHSRIIEGFTEKEITKFYTAE